MFSLLVRFLTLLPRFVIEQVRQVHSDEPTLTPLQNSLLRWFCIGIVILVTLLIITYIY